MAAKSGRGVQAFESKLGESVRRLPSVADSEAPPSIPSEKARLQHERYDWAERIVEKCVSRAWPERRGRSETLDRALTHPVLGVILFSTAA